MNDIIKGLVCAAVGVALGIVINSSTDVVMISIISVVSFLIVILVSIAFRTEKNGSRKPQAGMNMSGSNNINRNMNSTANSAMKSNSNASVRTNAAGQNTSSDARISRAEAISPAKVAPAKRGKGTVRELVLINEEGDVLFTWSIQGKTSLIIGKSTPKEPVDIDLSMSAMGQMISKQHAVLNYTNDGWCVDDIDSKNGTRVRKLSQNAIMDVKLVGSVQVEAGDIIYIASTMLQLR